MTRFRGLWCSGVLMLAIGCVRTTFSTPVHADTVEALPTAEQILGLTLDHPLVQQFVAGVRLEQLRHRDVVYMVAEDRGFELRLDDGVITIIVLYRKYTGPMPGGIEFGDRPKRVHERLGAPIIEDLRRDRGTMWIHEKSSIHVEYGSNGGIKMVTLIHPNRQ